jgi:hypothetical protein
MCTGERAWDYFTIAIGMPRAAYDFSQLGETTVYYTDGSVIGAQIQIADPKPRVLEHELGHALGWLHWSRRRHMMHPNRSDGGWEDDGLRRNTKQETHKQGTPRKPTTRR